MENVMVPRLPVAGSTILICPRAVRYRPVPPVIAPSLTDGGLLRNCTGICPAASTKLPWQAASGWEDLGHRARETVVSDLLAAAVQQAVVLDDLVALGKALLAQIEQEQVAELVRELERLPVPARRTR